MPSPEFDRGELVALIQLLRSIPTSYSQAFAALPSAERKLRILLAEISAAETEPEKPKRGRPRKTQ